MDYMKEHMIIGRIRLCLDTFCHWRKEDIIIFLPSFLTLEDRRFSNIILLTSFPFFPLPHPSSIYSFHLRDVKAFSKFFQYLIVIFWCECLSVFMNTLWYFVFIQGRRWILSFGRIPNVSTWKVKEEKWKN